MKSLLFIFVLFSCATHNTPSPKSRLFPYGAYVQKISFTKDSELKKYDSVTNWTRGKLAFEVKNSQGVTQVKYDEDLKAYKKTVFINRPDVPLTDEKALFYFSFLKFLYSLDRSICEGKSCKYEFMGAEYLFELGADDSVKNIRMARGEKNFNIETLSFTPL